MLLPSNAAQRRGTRDRKAPQCQGMLASMDVRCAHYGKGVPGYNNRWLAGSTNFLTDFFITFKVVFANTDNGD